MPKHSTHWGGEVCGRGRFSPEPRDACPRVPSDDARGEGTTVEVASEEGDRCANNCYRSPLVN